MNLVLSIQDKRSTLDQLIDDLKYALRDIKPEELAFIFLSASVSSISTTVKTKITAAKNLYQFGRKTFDRYKTDGFMNALTNDITAAKEMAASLPAKSKKVYDNFLALPKDKQIEAVISVIFISSIFLACGGGTDLEGGLPDMDIAIAGIGHHRSVVSHSIIAGLTVEFTGRLAVQIIQKVYNRLPEGHHQVWDRVYNFIEANKELAISAMWLGIAAHLIKDSGIIAGGVKPYSDIPVSMSQSNHQILFASNGMASGIFSVNKK